MQKTKVIIRVNGGLDIGMGHVYRGIALGEMLKEEFDIVFLLDNNSIAQPIIKAQFKVEKIDVRVLTINEPTWVKENFSTDCLVVLDGYDFNRDYQSSLLNFGFRLILIDDFIQKNPIANLVINHCPGTKVLDYQAANQSIRFGLGVNYALIRKPFVEFDRSKERIINQMKKILISFGGSSPMHIAQQTLLSVMKIKGVEEIHLLGNSSSDFVDSQIDERVMFHKDLDENEVFELMNSIDLAIVPASTISIELASIGIPMILGYFVENQQNIYNGFKDNEMVLGLGDYNTFNYSKMGSLIAEMSRKDLKSTELTSLFNGNPANNISRLFRALELSVRRAVADDMGFVFNLANDPIVRENTFNSDLILLDIHRLWFNNQIEVKSVEFYIIEYRTELMAQVRFKILEEHAVIGISIAANYRGKGLASEILNLATKRYFESNSKPIWAYVKKVNSSSSKAFERAGYSWFKDEVVDECDSFVYKIEMP
jgi:spore coat polysaccharide biosynthesis predicted glycosyltransferase SpsG